MHPVRKIYLFIFKLLDEATNLIEDSYTRSKVHFNGGLLEHVLRGRFLVYGSLNSNSPSPYY